jgi:hypothetical protein
MIDSRISTLNLFVQSLETFLELDIKSREVVS